MNTGASQVALVVKNAPANAREAEELVFDPWIGNTPCRRKRQLIPVFWSGKSRGPRSLLGYNPRGRKRWDRTEQTHTHEHWAICQIPFDLLMSIFIPLPSE